MGPRNSRDGILLGFPWSRGKTTSKLWLSVKYGVSPLDSRILCMWRISLWTFSRVISRGDLYGSNGRNWDSGFGFISAFNLWTIDPVGFGASSCNGLRFPKAVIGSAMRLGRGTNGTFSQGTSRLCWVKMSCGDRFLVHLDLCLWFNLCQ